MAVQGSGTGVAGSRRWGRSILTVGAVAVLGFAPAVSAPAIAGPAVGSAPVSTLTKADPAHPPFWPQVLKYERTKSEPVALGVSRYAETYQTVEGDQRSQVVEVRVGKAGPRVDMVQSHDRITDPPNEVLLSMGTRTNAVAGINGDYFDIHKSGAPRGGVIRSGRILKSPRPAFNAQLAVRPDGSLKIGRQTYTASVSDGTASHVVNSLNVVKDMADGGITRITRDLGETTGLPASTFVFGHGVGDGSVFTVDKVETGVTTVPELHPGQQGLLGAGAGGQWLADEIKPGEKLTVKQSISPDNRLSGLISGATVLVKDGKEYVDPTGEPPGGDKPGRNPETAVGISKDGRAALLVVVDGRDGKNALGLTPKEATGYFLAHGVSDAILLDGGGSSEIIARKFGEKNLSILNKPSDKAERPVANGIFVY